MYHHVVPSTLSEVPKRSTSISTFPAFAGRPDWSAEDSPRPRLCLDLPATDEKEVLADIIKKMFVEFSRGEIRGNLIKLMANPPFLYTGLPFSDTIPKCMTHYLIRFIASLSIGSIRSLSQRRSDKSFLQLILTSSVRGPRLRTVVPSHVPLPRALAHPGLSLPSTMPKTYPRLGPCNGKISRLPKAVIQDDQGNALSDQLACTAWSWTAHGDILKAGGSFQVNHVEVPFESGP